MNTTNYKETFEILHKRYGNKQDVNKCTYATLPKLPKIKSSNDINGKREMYDQIEVCVRNLKTLNMDIASYGAIIVPFLNGKLPRKSE